MWSEERAPPRSHASDGYHRVVNCYKRPPLLDKRPPLLDKRPPLLARPDEGGYSRYFSHVDYRECDEGHSFSHDGRSGPPHRGDDSGYRWTRDDHSTSQQPEYRDMRDERSPHKRDAPFFRESPVGWKDSPHSRSGSSLSSRSYSPERSRTHSVHQSQNRKSAHVGASYKRQNEANPGRGKERSIQSLKTSRDTSPSRPSAVSSSKVLDKPRQPTEKEPPAVASRWANENEISEFETGSMAPLFIHQTEEPESNTTDGTEVYEDSQISSRSKAIASKTKEIEQVYRQGCETCWTENFRDGGEMLIEKDPSLEKSIQFALRQNLHEIGERCVEELKHFITEYDNSTQDFGHPILEELVARSKKKFF
uniref:Periphilin-1 C-terminal domain-containing protein n=1 Tax=Cricetulus griseus TaxID=10029 RepID=A0A8C2M8Q9_CRIGR